MRVPRQAVMPLVISAEPTLWPADVVIGRPSKLYVRVDGSGDQIDRVEVSGSAVTVARGEFRI